MRAPNTPGMSVCIGWHRRHDLTLVLQIQPCRRRRLGASRLWGGHDLLVSTSDDGKVIVTHLSKHELLCSTQDEEFAGCRRALEHAVKIGGYDSLPWAIPSIGLFETADELLLHVPASGLSGPESVAVPLITGPLGASAVEQQRGIGLCASLCCASPLLADAPLANADLMHGAIAIVQRGHCSFELKARHCAAAGAVAVIIVHDGTTKAVGPMIDPTYRAESPLGIPVTMALPSSADLPHLMGAAACELVGGQRLAISATLSLSRNWARRVTCTARAGHTVVCRREPEHGEEMCVALGVAYKDTA